MPESCGEDGALGNAALDPAIAEVVAAEKFSDAARAGEKCAQVAGGALVEVAPADVELGRDDDRGGRRSGDGGHARSGGCAALSQEVKPTIDLAERHESFKYSVAGGQEVWIQVGASGMPRRQRVAQIEARQVRWFADGFGSGGRQR